MESLQTIRGCLLNENIHITKCAQRHLINHNGPRLCKVLDSFAGLISINKYN
jgi:hypothetical protein